MLKVPKSGLIYFSCDHPVLSYTDASRYRSLKSLKPFTQRFSKTNEERAMTMLKVKNQKQGSNQSKKKKESRKAAKQARKYVLYIDCNQHISEISYGWVQRGRDRESGPPWKTSSCYIFLTIRLPILEKRLDPPVIYVDDLQKK